jgi:allantoin racemase
MPVVGAGEAGLNAAAALGRRFALIQVWPAWARWIDEELLSTNGMGERCCAIRNVSNAGEEDDVHLAMIAGESGRAGMIARIVETMHAAVREDGADVLLLGCTCMSAAADELATHVEVPVVDPLKAAYLAAEQAARAGIKNSIDGTPADERERLAAVYLDIGALLADGRLDAGNQLENCEICAPIQPEMLAELEAEQRSRRVTPA